MRAFQLKITIMGSEPAIWRRIIVPTGITFSQFSMILNEAMGWSGEHLFEFEFKKSRTEINILENIAELGYGAEDCVEASKTYIGEYLESYKGFTYIYDFGDDWRHQVKVEKVLENYENNYPIVVDYEQNCPIEDCGGIWGYYDYLESFNHREDFELEEEDEDDEWFYDEMEAPEEYDMDAVNESFKTYYFYQWGKGERRFSHLICGEIFSKKCGLKATKQDKNQDIGIIELDNYRQEKEWNFQKQLEQMFGYKKEWEENIGSVSLEEIFSDYTKEDLKDIAKDKGMKGISKCNKSILIQKLIEHMLQPDRIKSYFLCLHDEEIKEFEKACKVDGLYTPEEVGNFTVLYDACYVGSLLDGRFVVPKEVKEAYETFQGTEFEEERKKCSYFLCCLDTANALYGITPISILEQLVVKNPEVQMTKEEMKLAMNQIPEEINECILVEDTIYRRDLYPDDRELLMAQGDIEFYIPTLKEIIEFGKNGYISDSREIKKLKQFLMKKMGAVPEEADIACRIMQLQMTAGCDSEDLFHIFEELNLGVHSESQERELAKHVEDLWNSTRMLINRGFTQREFVLKNNNGQALIEEDNIINFAEAKKNKIYPNEPCPCGSGKKFKNCCKNK